MVTLRCTQKLLRRLKGATQSLDTAPTTKLGDWYLNILFYRPQHLLLCASERTLLPVLLPARDLGTVAPRLCQALGEVLSALEIPQPMIAAELREMESCIFGPTANRQVLGSMNDFAHMMAWRRYAGQEGDLLQMALDLAKSPCSPLRHNSPDRATRQVFWGDQPQARPLFN
jgi:hypothetical protein